MEEGESKRAKETQRQRLMADLAAERKEKDALMLRNAELSQNVTTLKSQLASATAVATATIATASPPTPPEESYGESDKAQSETSLQVLDVESSTGGGGGKESGDSSVAEMTKTIADLQNQLAERNKTVKLQQQRIGDLRKTIQRELKMQSGGGGGGGANGLSTQG